MFKSKSLDPLESIQTSIDILDREMNTHKDNCLRCIENKKCAVWEDFVESWNFYSLGLRRYLKTIGESDAQKEY